MRDDPYGYCKIFVNAAHPELVKSMLADLLGGTFHRRDMLIDGLAVSVLRNDDAAEPPRAEDDFVRWPLLIELDAEEPATAGRMRVTTARILTALWASSHPAVAACDFEDELPWRGGIARIGQPPR